MLQDNTSPIGRREFIKTTGAVGSVGALAGCLSSSEEETGDSSFPERDIDLIIPFGPGGGYDTYSRLTAPYVEEYFDNEISVNPQNVEGSGGRIATEQVASAEPDGYTNMIINLTNFALTQITQDVSYDLREFSIFAQVVKESRAIAVGSNTDIETWDDFVTRVQNEEISFASTGPGSDYVTIPGVVGEVGNQYPAQNVIDNQVVYGGRSESLQGILAGDAHVLAGSYSSILPFVQSGDLRMIMVVSGDEEPPEDTPDAATLSSSGVDNASKIADMVSTRRLFGGTPGISEERTTKLREAYSWAIQNDDLQAEAAEKDRRIVYADHERSKEAIDTFINEWSNRQDLLNTLFQDS